MECGVNTAYAGAGVDIHAGYKSVELIKKHVRSTFTKGVLSDIGGFGGMFSLDRVKHTAEPVMVSGTDGVGTKLLVAQMLDKHDTVGIDLVAMCVNDIVCNGAEPLFFLDYIACGKNVPERIELIVKGIADGCKQANTALVGGETAEHPDMMGADEYDLAGFAAGIVDRKNIINGKGIRAGDVLIGLASSGVHSNGFSLIRKVLKIDNDKLGETLLTPTRIYVNSILSLIKTLEIKGISNITGGGFHENIPRILPNGLTARIFINKIQPQPIFDIIQQAGNINTQDMYNTFNMGVGMVVCVSKENADETNAALDRLGEKAYVIGEIIEGNEGLCLE